MKIRSGVAFDEYEGEPRKVYQLVTEDNYITLGLQCSQAAEAAPIVPSTPNNA